MYQIISTDFKTVFVCNIFSENTTKTTSEFPISSVIGFIMTIQGLKSISHFFGKKLISAEKDYYFRETKFGMKI